MSWQSNHAIQKGGGQQWGGAQQWGGKAARPAVAPVGGQQWGGKGKAATPGLIKPSTTPIQPAWKKAATAQPVARAITPAVKAVTPEQAKAKIAKLTGDFAAAEKTTTTAMDASKVVLENEKATAASTKVSIDSLERQKTKLAEVEAKITTEVAEVRKTGPPSLVQELARLLVNCKKLNPQVTIQVNRLKAKQQKLERDAEVKAKEAKDSAAFKAVLAKSRAECVGAENAVSAVGRQATPMVAKPPEAGEALDKKIENIQTAAIEALAKIEIARKELNEKIKLIQTYAPEAKKTAQTALMELQRKLADSTKTGQVYKTFKVQFPRLVENQKAIVEVTEKLAGHEAPIAKATDVAKAAKLTKAQVKTIDDGLEPVLKAIQEANTIIATKMRSADPATQEKFTKLKTRGEELKTKIAAVSTKIKGQKDIIKSEEAIETANEMLAKVEECWKACGEAEMPFLTGVEVLEGDISEKTLKECQEASVATTQAVKDIRNWVQAKMREANAFEKDLAKSTNDELKPFLASIQEADGKLGKFRKETAERKATAVLVPALEAVEAFEKKVKEAEGVGAGLASASLEDETAESINASIEKSKTALGEAATSHAEAKKVLGEKQRGLQHDHPTLQLVHSGLNAGQDKLGRMRASISSAERLVRTKAAITSGEEKMKEVEAEVEKVKKLVPAEGKGFSMEGVTSFDAACAALVKTITAAQGVIQPHIGSAPTKAKATLQSLLERKTAAHAVVTKAKGDTKELRESTTSDHFLAEAETNTKAAETAAVKMDEAEGPFLLGSSHDLAKTKELLAKCDDAASAVHAAIADSKKYSGAKSQASRAFGEASAKKAREGFAAMADRIQKVAAKLATFEKDSRDRAKESRMVEAAEKTDEVEADVKKTLAAVEPFEKEGAENLTEAEAAVPLKAFMEVEGATLKKLSVLRSFLGSRLNEQRTNKEQSEAVKQLQERATKASQDLADKKKFTAIHETRALGTRLLAEATEQVAGLDSEVKKATEACAPLLEHGGENFLVAASVKTLVTALKAHMKAKELSEEALFKEAGGKKMKEAAFVKYLAGLSEAIGRDELNSFSDARRAAVFKQIAADGKNVTSADFVGMLEQKHYTCIKPTTVTNQFAVEGSETVCKVENSALVELSGPTKEDEAGLVRSECTVGDKKGWITVKQNKGAAFLLVTSPYKAFCSTVDKAISEAMAAVNKSSGSLAAKLKQGGEAKEGRLKEARDEMAKLKEPIAKALKAMDELKTKVGKARGDYANKERTEANAHIEARNAKEAAPFVDGPKHFMEGLEADAKSAEEIGTPMISLTGEDLQAFATPASVAEQMEKLAESVTEKAVEARAAIKEQTKAVSEVTPQTSGTAEAKKQLRNMGLKADELINKTKRTLSQVKNKCKILVDGKLDPIAAGIREHAAKKSLTLEALFDSLKKGEKIAEAAFCKLVESLDGLSVNAELAKLVCRKLEAEGISKDAFMNWVVVYYKVVKTIAYTDLCDIAKCNTIRKGEEGEVVEVLEGPVTDESNGMTRLRAKSTRESGTIGWITLSGSKGTAFLEKTTKPVKKAEASEKKA